MKTPYMKPVFAVELFSGTQTTTRDCWDSIITEDVHFNDLPDCWWEPIPDVRLFLENTACKENGEIYGWACYNTPGEGQYLFRS